MGQLAIKTLSQVQWSGLSGPWGRPNSQAFGPGSLTKTCSVPDGGHGGTVLQRGANQSSTGFGHAAVFFILSYSVEEMVEDFYGDYGQS